MSRRFKCPECGSRMHRDMDNTYECAYCGYEFSEDEKDNGEITTKNFFK